MKKTFFTSIAVSATLVSGIVLGTLDAGSASACAFAQGKSIFGSNTTFHVNPNKLILGVAAATGAITVAGVLTYRRFHPGQPPEDVAANLPSVFPIPIPPAALNAAVEVEEAAETSKIS
ncbi:hypothetical protein [Microcystis aeruginosa]|uniref:Uncharacterized protein n=1 Tax=Microcystis aeruginosa Ma_QC_C_20070703_M131 TaxID=2486263 RepID=A0A551X4I0_MICAE|nr:hypothetical protein [Microcystis aeruginosa]MDB9392891.1 hypothetical protein [Microcystis aeruginosa CS-579]TRT43644.1 MAG: hypothetical protein EWV85_21660 [Microcystis aeruginosa Ma_QC_C_20070703_M131]